MMKRCSIVAGLLLVFASGAAKADKILTNESSWAKPFSVKIPVSSSKGIVISYRKGVFTAALPGGGTQVLGEKLEPEDAFRDRIVVRVGDFNFDGHGDIAIDTSVGYGGVNIFSSMYFWQPAKNRFSKVFEISNFEIDSKARLLTASMKSGPGWYGYEYKFDQRGWPWKFHETQGPGNVAVHKYFNQAGKVVKKIVADVNGPDGEPVPAVFTVQIPKVYFYTSPDENAKTGVYIIKGDKVTVIDEAGDFSRWYKIRYVGKKTFVRWVKSSDFDYGN